MKKLLIIIMLFCAANAEAQIVLGSVKIGKSTPTLIDVNGATTSTAELTEDVAMGDIVYLNAIGANKTAAISTSVTLGTAPYSSISGDGNFVAIAHNNSPYIATYKWNSGNNRYESTDAVDVGVTGIANKCALSSNGAYLVVAHSGSTSPARFTSYKWNESNNRYEQTAAPDSAPSNTAYGIDITPDGSRVVVINTSSPRLISYNWNETNNRYERTNDPDFSPSGYSSVSVSSTGARVVVGSGSAADSYLRTYIWDTFDQRYEIANPAFPAMAAAVNGAKISADGNKLVCVSSAATPGIVTYRWSNTNTRYERMTYPDYNNYLAADCDMSSDGKDIFIVYSASPFYFLHYRLNDANTQYQLMPLADIMPGGSPRSIAVADDISKVFVTHILAPRAESYLTLATPTINISKWNNPVFFLPDNYQNLIGIGYMTESGVATELKSMKNLYKRLSIY